MRERKVAPQPVSSDSHRPPAEKKRGRCVGARATEALLQSKASHTLVRNSGCDGASAAVVMTMAVAGEAMMSKLKGDSEQYSPERRCILNKQPAGTEQSTGQNIVHPAIHDQDKTTRNCLLIVVTSMPMNIPPRSNGKAEDLPDYHILTLEASEDTGCQNYCTKLTEQSGQKHVYLVPRPKSVHRVLFAGEMRDLSRLNTMKYEWSIDPSLSRDPLRFEVPVDYSTGEHYSLIVDGNCVASNVYAPC